MTNCTLYIIHNLDGVNNDCPWRSLGISEHEYNFLYGNDTVENSESLDSLDNDVNSTESIQVNQPIEQPTKQPPRLIRSILESLYGQNANLADLLNAGQPFFRPFPTFPALNYSLNNRPSDGIQQNP